MRILLVEDDRSLAMAALYHLKKAGYEAQSCANGESGLSALQDDGHWDLVLLDRMMPVMGGDEMLHRMREERIAVPVLMLTAMDEVSDRVQGLDLGADDYLVKPFAMEELLARIRALLRRPAQWAPPDAMRCGDLSLDRERMLLGCESRTAQLSRREAMLMEFLLTNRGQVLPRGVLLDRVWQDSFVEDGNLDIYIHFLRKHLRALKSKARIETVRGVGYRLAAG